MEPIKDIIGRLWRGVITPEQAEVEMTEKVPAATLAEFIIDAHQRGWISNSNIGLNADGYP